MKTLAYTAKCSGRTHKNLSAFLEQQRALWNAALEQRRAAYKRAGISLSAIDQQKDLTALRKDPEFGQYDAACQRTAIRRLHKAFQRFFARRRAGKQAGFPRFKGKGRVRSFDHPQPSIKRINKRWVLNVKGVGKFRFKHDGRLDVQPVMARIVSTACRVKIQLMVDTPDCDWDDKREPLGVDLGITSQVSLSDGAQFPRRRRSLVKIKRLQRQLSKACKGSHARQKKRLSLQKEQQRIVERERGYLHELTTCLVRERSSKFYVEDLRIGNMVKNHRLARSILEQQWGSFVQMLTYKAESAGGWVGKGNPRNTSQRCSGCGAMPEKRLTLSDRTYVCLSCGLVLDRDVNAARNILQVGDNLPGGGLPVHSEDEKHGPVGDGSRTQNSIPRIGRM